MNDLIDFFFSFRFFHFLFISGAIIYLIKTRLNPLIDKEIAIQKNEDDQLKETLSEFKKLNKEMVINIDQQDLKGQKLLDCIITWKRAIEQKEKEKIIVKGIAQEALKKFAKDQEHALLMKYYTRQIIPHSIDEAHQILEKKFNDLAAQEDFLKHSFALMKAGKK